MEIPFNKNLYQIEMNQLICNCIGFQTIQLLNENYFPRDVFQRLLLSVTKNFIKLSPTFRILGVTNQKEDEILISELSQTVIKSSFEKL